jgi:predicted nucleic acid-binding protein
MLFDSTFLIHAAGQRGRVQLVRAEAFLKANLDAPLYTSRVCWAEFAEGCLSVTEVETALNRFTVIEINELVAWETSRISRVLGKSGMTIGDSDIWIAATALAYQLPLVSRNVRHFARVHGLDVRDY